MRRDRVRDQVARVNPLVQGRHPQLSLLAEYEVGPAYSEMEINAGLQLRVRAKG